MTGPGGLDHGLFQSLTTCGWIRDGHHVLIGGQPACASPGLPSLNAEQRRDLLEIVDDREATLNQVEPLAGPAR